MARTWLVITVELVSGGMREDLWPRPARVFVAARTHSFEQLAEAIDDAFGRWDLNHLHEFTLADGTCIGEPDLDWDEDREIVDSRRTRLSRLALGEQFAYVFDLGDYWAHLCTVGPERADPVKSYGTVPTRPVAIFGWGDLPDQYGRRWGSTTVRAACRATRRAVTCHPSCRSGAGARSRTFRTRQPPLAPRERGLTRAAP